MPPYPETIWVHTLFFALNLMMQEIILKWQGLFDTWNKLQKLAVELEALKAKKTKCREHSRIDDVSYEKAKMQERTHNHWVKKVEQRHAMQNNKCTPNT